MNKGLRRATGDYVWFLNAGDTLPSADLVQTIVQKIAKRKYHPDVIYGDTAIVNNEGRVLGMRHLRPPKKLTWKKFAWGMLVCHQAFIARRELAPEYDPAYPLCADYDWCIRVMSDEASSRTLQHAAHALPFPRSRHQHATEKSIFEGKI